MRSTRCVLLAMMMFCIHSLSADASPDCLQLTEMEDNACYTSAVKGILSSGKASPVISIKARDERSFLFVFHRHEEEAARPVSSAVYVPHVTNQLFIIIRVLRW
jgi:hypothetical protein